MSQISSTASGIIPPGAGVLRLHTNPDNVDVPPNGAGTIIVEGAGGIVASGAGNTVTITNTLAGAQFNCDIGHAIPVAGLLNVVGTPNQIQTAGTGNNLVIGLALDVIAPRDLTTTRDLFSNRFITAARTVIAGQGLRAAAGGIVSTGQVVLHDPTLPIGVVQINGAGNVFSDAGPAGSFIISSGPTNQPAWRNLTSPLGTIDVAFDPGTGNITIDTGPTTTDEFYAKDGSHAHIANSRFYYVGDTGPNANINSTANQTDPNYANNPSITFSLADDIHIVRDIFARRNITATAGNILATNGDVTANGRLVALTNGCNITGNPFFNSLATGVAQIAPSGRMFSTSGTDGQVIISSNTPGHAPDWANLTAGPGILITNGDRSITIATAAAAANYAFKLQQPGTGYIWGVYPVQYFGAYAGVRGTGTQPLNIVYNGAPGFLTAGAPNIPATFTAPVTGLYEFHFKIELYAMPQAPADYPPQTAESICLYIQRSHPAVLETLTFKLNAYWWARTPQYPANYPPGVTQFTLNGEYTDTIRLDIGDTVVFGIWDIGHAGNPDVTAGSVGIGAGTTISGHLIS